MIKFIPTEKEESSMLMFQDVNENQFFVNLDGSLCQKLDEETYCTIADCDGDPFCTYDTAYGDDEIQRIIEHIGKIEF